MSVINGTGAGIEAIYVLIFLIYAPKKEKAKVFGLVTFVLVAFSTVALVSVFAFHGKTRRYFCGFAAAIFSVIMYGSPLSIMVSNLTLWFIKTANLYLICLYFRQVTLNKIKW